MRNKIKKQSGISLIEVLVSAVLISMIFLWISDTHIASLADIADTNNRNKATWLVEEMIERIKVNPMIDKYKTEIENSRDKSAYCLTPIRCNNSECSEDNIVKYDVQQIICSNLEGINNLEINIECLDLNTGVSFNPCYTAGAFRGRISITWQSKDPSRGQLSTYSDVLFDVNQSLYFDGNDYLSVSGYFFNNNFSIAMWVKPARLSALQGLFGNNELNRLSALFISSGDGISYDSYSSNLANRFFGNDEARGGFQINQWVHVAWIKKGNEYLFYKDGVLSFRREGISESIYNSSNNSWIGTVGLNPFRGELDDIHVYGSALSEAQLFNVMEGHPLEDKNLLLYLDFDGNTFSEAVSDKSGMNRVISINGGMNDNSRRHVVR